MDSDLNCGLDFDPRSDFNRTTDLPLHRQLYLSMSERIRRLELMPGQLMPSTRVLAEQLGVSRTTVVRAYDELLGQGFIKAIDGVGTFVAETTALPAELCSESEKPPRLDLGLSHVGTKLLKAPSYSKSTSDLRGCNRDSAPLEFLPAKQWRQIVLQYFRESAAASAGEESELLGYQPLRKALSGYLKRSRAIVCDPSNVALVNGSFNALKLLVMLFLDESDTVLVENPGSAFAREQFALSGARIVAVPVDEDGIRIDYLHNNPVKAKMIWVQIFWNDQSWV